MPRPAAARLVPGQGNKRAQGVNAGAGESHCFRPGLGLTGPRPLWGGGCAKARKKDAYRRRLVVALLARPGDERANLSRPEATMTPNAPPSVPKARVGGR